MNILTKLMRADDSRISRLHDANGTIHMNFDMLRAFISTAKRHLFGIYPNLPWLTYSSIRFLETHTQNKTVFEFGSGSSTEWFSRNASEVTSVENNPEWADRVKAALDGRGNAKLIIANSYYEFTNCLSKFGSFDVYIIDCQSCDDYPLDTESLRILCLEQSKEHSNESSIFIVDNTDTYKNLSKSVERIFENKLIKRFSGWAPGILHPNETTIVFASSRSN